MVPVDNKFFPLIFNTISHGIFTIDGEGRITSFNKAAEEMCTGYREQDVIGISCAQIFRTDICQELCPLKRSIASKQRIENRQVKVLTKQGQRIPIFISTAALIDDEGKVIGGVEMFRDISTESELKKQLYSSYCFEDIVTKSPAMKGVLEMLPLVAVSQSTVLINGESGTGKELVARAIHNHGPRCKAPFVAINCAALPDTLLESELFGYTQGAFTDAKKDKPGRFARAERGTLFLDEVGDLSLVIQSKLLRVLQEKEYEPLGSNQPVKANVRIIAATNKDLTREVQRKRFRQDLFFRLNVVNISLPPLRERREDIPILVDHFIQHFNAVQGRRILRCSERVMAALMKYEFPGNVRELENAIEHAYVVCGGDTIRLDHLPSHIVAAFSQQRPPDDNHTRPLEYAEADVISNTLTRNHGNRNATSAELGISRNTLWRKMKKYRIEY
ncbi:MAG: sigma 54-interacting transcriptional regulator [Deltaproteobacteria bacterium]|nr:sigma 54-interacting transcriptional regulator [Deltaproteobacteria bacterium]